MSYYKQPKCFNLYIISNKISIKTAYFLKLYSDIWMLQKKGIFKQLTLKIYSMKKIYNAYKRI